MPADELRENDLAPCGCASPGASDPATCYCGVEDLLRIIRRRYSLTVMNAVHGRGSARYHDIATAVPRISSSTLAETLRALEAAGLMSRRDLSDTGGPHTEYRLTPSGTKLLARLRTLLDEVQLPE